MTAVTQRRAMNKRLAPGSRLTLREALPREMVRVACEVLPEMARRGHDGQAVLDAIIGSLRLAAYGMAHANAGLMRRAHAELLGFQL